MLAKINLLISALALGTSLYTYYRCRNTRETVDDILRPVLLSEELLRNSVEIRFIRMDLENMQHDFIESLENALHVERELREDHLFTIESGLREDLDKGLTELNDHIRNLFEFYKQLKLRYEKKTDEKDEIYENDEFIN